MSNKLFVVLIFFILCTKISKTEDNKVEFNSPEEHYPLKYIVLPSCLIIFAVIRHVFKARRVPIPYPVFCICFGFLWGIVCRFNSWLQRAIDSTHISTIEYNFRHVITPVILFSTAFCVDVHTVKKSLSQIVIIAFPVALFSGITTGIFMQLVIDSHNRWTRCEAIIFGVLTIAVYPIDILHWLKEASIQIKYVTAMLQGETLVSTTISVFVFDILLGSLDRFVTHWYQYAMLTARALICSFLGGYIFGLISCCFMKFVYNDSILLILLTLSFSLTSYCTVEWLCCAGAVGPTFVGIMMGSNRHYLSKDVENNVTDFWKIACYVVNDYIYLVVGRIASEIMQSVEGIQNFVMVIVTFLTSSIVRFIYFFLFSPILSRTGYGMSFKTMFVCFWSGLRCPVSLSLVMSLVPYRTDEDMVKIIFIHIVGVHFLYLLINGTCMRIILKILALWEISSSRQITMNNCMKYIYEARTRNIAILKMDRFLSDANWPLVMSITALKHPYKKMENVEDLEGENEDEDYFLGYRYTFCPDCQKHVPNEPTPKEMKEMTQEAKLRILKLKKTTYSRQFENGMVSREGIRILHQAVEVAMDSAEQIILLDGLFKLFTKESSFYKYIQRQLHEIFQTKGIVKIPKLKWMLWCYIIVHHYAFFAFMNVVLLLHIIVNCLFFQLTENGFLGPIVVFGSVYFLEMVMRIFGYTIRKDVCGEGVKTYFTFCWNILSFVIFSTTIIEVLATLFFKKVTIYVIYTLIALLALRLFRVLIFLNVFACLKPVLLSILKYLDIKIYNNKIMGFELATNFIIGEEEILENLSLIVDNENIRKSIKEQTENDRTAVCRRIGISQKEHPWFISTAKTRAAIRAVLNSLKEDIHELKSSGWVDDMEYYRLMNSLAERYKNLSTIHLIEPTAPRLIFETLPFLGYDDSLIEDLYKHVSTKKFDPGSTVLEQGVSVDGIYILITGLLLVSYNPNESIRNKLKEAGIIPVVDLISATYDQPVKEYILPGAALGDHSALTGRPYDGQVIAETHSEVYFLKADIIKKAISSDINTINGFESRLWKGISFRRAISIMMNVPAYRTSTKENMKYLVERSFVPDLSNYKVFVINAMMQDVILIEGIAVDSNTREIFTAPFYIPKGVERLILPRSSTINIDVIVETKLMIIPARDYDEFDVMVEEEETCELVSNDSSKCLRHLIKSKLSAGTFKSSSDKGGFLSSLARELRKAFLSTDASTSRKSKITFSLKESEQSTKTVTSQPQS